MNPTNITIQATVKAEIAKVWKYYTNPEHIIHWNFASDDWCCPSASNDLKVGGKYIARMEAKDGSFGFDFEAIYDEIVAPQTLTYTMTDGRKVNVSLHEANGATEVTVIFEAENENPIDLQQQGWQMILNNFKAYVEKN